MFFMQSSTLYQARCVTRKAALVRAPNNLRYPQMEFWKFRLRPWQEEEDEGSPFFFFPAPDLQAKLHLLASSSSSLLLSECVTTVLAASEGARGKRRRRRRRTSLEYQMLVGSSCWWRLASHSFTYVARENKGKVMTQKRGKEKQHIFSLFHPIHTKNSWEIHAQSRVFSFAVFCF